MCELWIEEGSKTYFRVRNPNNSQKPPPEIPTALKASSSWMDSVRKEQKSMVFTYRDRFPTGRVEGARRFSPASRLSGVSLLWTKMGGGASPGRRPQPFDARRFQIVDPQGAWYSMILNHFAIVFGRASHPRPDHLEYYSPS